MPFTWIDVCDSAIKIGLGALIGGGFTLASTLFSSRRKLAEALTTDKRAQMLKISDEICEIHTMFLDHASTLAAFLPAFELKGKSHKAIREIVEQHLFEQSPELQRAMFRLHEIEARLCVLGFEPIAAVLEDYRIRLTDITVLDAGDKTISAVEKEE